ACAAPPPPSPWWSGSAARPRRSAPASGRADDCSTGQPFVTERSSVLLGVEFVPLILHRRNRLERLVDQHAVLFDDAADIDVTHGIARRWVDRDWTGRALPGIALDRRDGLVTVARTVGRLQHVENDFHAVIAERGDVLIEHLGIGSLESRDELLVHRVVEIRVVVPRRNDPDGGIADRR